MSQPTKLNLWDRLFNRYRREVIGRGNETWDGWSMARGSYLVERDFVEYKVTDLVTGSEKIEREYLN